MEKGFNISATVKYTAKGSIKLYYDLRWGDDFYEFKMELNHTMTFAEIKFSGSIGLNKSKVRIPIPDIPIGIFKLSINVYPVLSADASITLINFGVKVYNCVSLNDSNGFTKTNETKWLDMDDPDCGETKITIKAGLGLEFELGIKEGTEDRDGLTTICTSVSFVGEGYVRIVLDPSFVGVLTDKHHDCTFCLTGSMTLVIEGKLSFKLKLISDKLSWTWDALSIGESWPKGDCYLSIGKNGIKFGIGTCANIAYAVTVTVKDKNDKTVEGATVSTTTGYCDADNDGKFNETSMKTDKLGQATFYFKKGKHTLTAEKDGIKGDSGTIQVLSNEKSATIKLGTSGGSADDIVSGSCGENATYTLNKTTGELVISGTGTMWNGSYSTNSIFTNYSSYIKTLVIKSGIKSIGDYAFRFCNNLTSVTIPGSVKSIGEDAFYRCSGLKSVTIPDGVKSIGNNVFEDCNRLASITIPDSVTSIGGAAFKGCTSLESIKIPNSVTSIGGSLFTGCNNLKSVTIPNSVTSIGDDAFSGCSNLTSVTIPDSVTIIGAGAFNSCTSVEGVTIGNSVTIIGKHAFSNCTSLENVIIPNSVTIIGNDAFLGCTSLESVTIPDSVTSIGNEAFYGCTSLTSITIPNSVTSIGSDAFYYCTSLTSVTIPDSVTSIGIQTFKGCGSLKSITIPNSVTSIGNSAFENCRSLTSVTIPDSVTSIGIQTFGGCGSLKSVTIPNSVTSIGDRAFCGCASLTSVTIPDSVTSIGYGTFSNCSSLTSVKVSNSITSIGRGVFYDCISLKSIIIPDGVTSIGYHAFGDCISLTSIKIPNSVTSIDEEAFINTGYYNNGNNWEDGVLYIDKHLIIAKSSIASHDIKSGTLCIADCAFNGCTALTSVTIPNSVTSIGDSAFKGCTSLTSVTIGNSITSIGGAAFQGCTHLESVTIPNSVTRICNYAFGGCDSLTTVYYNGKQEQWNAISIGPGNTPLANANIIFTSSSTTNQSDSPTVAFFAAPTTLSATPTVFSTRSATATKTATKTDALEGSNYILLVVKDPDSEDMLSSDNLLYIDQKTADSNTITFDYVLPDGTSDYTATIYGVSHTHIKGNPVKENEVAATCTSKGSYDEVVYCTCGKEMSRKTVTVDELTHNYSETAKINSTCTDSGSITYTCVCGDSYTETIPAIGHSYPNAWSTIIEPTCTDKGVKIKICFNCHDVLAETMDKISHIDKNKDSICDNCGSNVKDTIGKHEHNYGDWAVSKEATHTEGGLKTKACTICGDILTEAIEKSKEHTYILSKTVAPTCAVAGSKAFTCACGDSYSEAIPTISHIDSNSDSYCDSCGLDLNPQAHCSCNCHKTGITKFFFTIINFFQKLFGNNKVCACGAIH